MELNNQYLCIVEPRGAAARGAADDLYLPFDGDTILSLILSKALLLAGDRSIKDAAILMQIRHVPDNPPA